MNRCCASPATDAANRDDGRSDGRDELHAPVDGLSAAPQTAAGDDDNDDGDGSAAAAPGPESWTAAGDAVAAVADDDGMDALDCYVMAYREDLAAGRRSAVDAEEQPLSLRSGRRSAVLHVAAAPVPVGRSAGDGHSSGRQTIGGWFGRLKRWLLRKDRVFAGKLHVRQVRYSKPPKRA